MKKSELKKILKPLVQECIKEVLLEGSLVSGIVAEVMRNTGTTKPIVESIEEDRACGRPYERQMLLVAKKPESYKNKERS